MNTAQTAPVQCPTIVWCGVQCNRERIYLLACSNTANQFELFRCCYCCWRKVYGKGYGRKLWHLKNYNHLRYPCTHLYLNDGECYVAMEVVLVWYEFLLYPTLSNLTKYSNTQCMYIHTDLRKRKQNRKHLIFSHEILALRQDGISKVLDGRECKTVRQLLLEYQPEWRLLCTHHDCIFSPFKPGE